MIFSYNGLCCILIRVVGEKRNNEYNQDLGEAYS